MSHLHERKEKNCLNCGTEVVGRYCHTCGQENLEPKESAWHLIVHFFNDVTHFDGKFFATIKHLITKPGFLTEEYVKGRRVSYLNPIRMYLFISAVFFLIIVNFFISEESSPVNAKPAVNVDSLQEVKHEKKKESLAKAIGADPKNYKKSNEIVVLLNNDSFTRWEINNAQIKTTKAYDSLQNLLPIVERDAGMKRRYTRKMIGAMNRTDESSFNHDLWANYYHSMPYVLFFSLPLIALILKLLYARRKEYYYVSHGIFVIHYFCLLFLGILLILALSKLGNWATIPIIILQLGLVVYLFLAMRRFYRQSWLKTSIKFLLLTSFSAIFFLTVFLILLLNSFINMG